MKGKKYMNKVIFKFNLFALSFLISGSSVAKPTHVPNIVNSINTTFANELGLNVDDKIKQENFDEVAPTSQKLNQYPKKDFLSLQGGVNGGGGNQIGDQLYDLYEGSRHTISEQEILSKIDSRLKALDVLPRFVDLLKNLVTKRRWYFVDQPLINLPPSYTGIYLIRKVFRFWQRLGHDKPDSSPYISGTQLFCSFPMGSIKIVGCQ
ncbi:MAG: hypothetical protein ACXWRE_09890, partial [Pseudobdellovibrionaceae bacterium]